MTDASKRNIDCFDPAASRVFRTAPTGISGTLDISAVASEAVIKAINESPMNRGLDGADWVANPNNIAIERGDNIALFDAEGDGVYQGHLLFGAPGCKAVHDATDAFSEMFEKHGAELIFGMVPVAAPHAKLVVRRAGGKYAGNRMTEFGECELYVLSREMWKGDDQ